MNILDYLNDNINLDENDFKLLDEAEESQAKRLKKN